MKKLLFLLVGLTLLLAACGGDESGESKDSETSGDDEGKTEISNKVFENEDYKFVFGDSEQITGTRDNQVLAIEVEFTNKSDEAESPWGASTVVLEQSEVTDVTTESVIGAVGGLPEDYKPDLYRMDEKINSGKTVDAVVAFELQSPGSTIKIANSTLSGEEKTFEKVIETTE